MKHHDTGFPSRTFQLPISGHNVMFNESKSFYLDHFWSCSGLMVQNWVTNVKLCDKSNWVNFILYRENHRLYSLFDYHKYGKIKKNVRLCFTVQMDKIPKDSSNILVFFFFLFSSWVVFLFKMKLKVEKTHRSYEGVENHNKRGKPYFKNSGK